MVIASEMARYSGNGLGCGEQRRRLRASEAPISGKQRRQTRRPRRNLNHSDDRDLWFGREISVREKVDEMAFEIVGTRTIPNTLRECLKDEATYYSRDKHGTL
ncbi:hypothetical protein Syun_000877 [Stephania yunnanensis]|uniref:Uncharacterized protein n=1 Tax=Stephania yunnanensis TaxID=152371 RepID=A0AAP0LEH2_9MAGN